MMRGTIYLHGLAIALMMFCRVQASSPNEAPKVPIPAIEILSDLNNDGLIDSLDEGLRTSSDPEKSTEYLFVNDDISNGIHGDRDDPIAPQGAANDDDVEELKIKCDLRSGFAWFEYPALVKLQFYEDKACKKEVIFPWNLSENKIPERVFIRANESMTMEIEGDLVFKAGKSDKSKIDAECKLKLTIVKQVGDKHFFQAAKDSIQEQNLSTLRNRFYPDARKNNFMEVVVFQEDRTTFTALDVNSAVSSRPETIHKVAATYPEYDVIMNGTLAGPINYNQGIYPEIYGAVISNGVLGASRCNINGIILDRTAFIGQKVPGTIDVVRGVIPSISSGHREALGQLIYYPAGNNLSEVGFVSMGHGIICLAVSNHSGSIRDQFGSALSASGASTILQVDGGGSEALAWRGPTELRVLAFGYRHDESSGTRLNN